MADWLAGMAVQKSLRSSWEPVSRAATHGGRRSKALTERTVTNDAGNEISRWTAVSDKDGNLLCEKQTAVGVLKSFSRYDYSCW